MNASPDRRHIFISHHHADDAEVTNLTNLLGSRNHDFRNSSIRAKPANKERLEKGLVSDEVIRRLLRRKISWASTIVVLVGEQTHSRTWVNWEIEEAYRQGKRIVGVFIRGGTEADIPANLREYGNALVAWNFESIVGAIDGEDNLFQAPDGSPAPPVDTARSVC